MREREPVLGNEHEDLAADALRAVTVRDVGPDVGGAVSDRLQAHRGQILSLFAASIANLRVGLVVARIRPRHQCGTCILHTLTLA